MPPEPITTTIGTAVAVGAAQGASKLALEQALTAKGRAIWDFLSLGKRGIVPGNREEYEALRAIHRGSEMQLLKFLLKDNLHRRLASDGILLRLSQGDPAKLKHLRTRIFRYGGVSGVRFSQAVQMGVVGFMIDHMATHGFTVELQMRELLQFFGNVTRLVRFVEVEDEQKKVAADVDGLMRLRPVMFFIAGIGPAGEMAIRVGDSAYKDFVGYSRNVKQQDGRVVFMLAQEGPDWVPPEVEEARRKKAGKPRKTRYR